MPRFKIKSKNTTQNLQMHIVQWRITVKLTRTKNVTSQEHGEITRIKVLNSTRFQNGKLFVLIKLEIDSHRESNLVSPNFTKAKSEKERNLESSF